MVAVALLSSYLSERLRLQGRELVERRGAVARLQALNENIIESINSGLITTTLNGQINFVNRGGTEILVCGLAEILDRDIQSVIQMHPDFLHEIRRRLLAEQRFRFENWVEKPDGQRIYLGVAVSNLYDKIGRPLGYIFIFQDLTEIHALELEVRLKERMAALGEMAAGMAHELRNPMASISGAVQYLKGVVGPQGESLELMDIILRESQRLDQTIRDFLTFTRPGSFSPEPTDVVHLLQNQLKLLRKSRECSGDHRIEARYASPKMICEVDPNRLTQIFWNLATNALKAMPDGGTLNIEFEWTERGDAVRLLFADDGVGMDERQKRLYFQPFNSSFREGTGLGTAIVYRLVQEHGGKVSLESGKGEGTRVWIELPREQAVSEQRDPAPMVRWAAGGEIR
jgi:two-component system sensor histidine kinase PilS (NtrC family)